MPLSIYWDNKTTVYTVKGTRTDYILEWESWDKCFYFSFLVQLLYRSFLWQSLVASPMQEFLFRVEVPVSIYIIQYRTRNSLYSFLNFKKSLEFWLCSWPFKKCLNWYCLVSFCMLHITFDVTEVKECSRILKLIKNKKSSYSTNKQKTVLWLLLF